MVTLSRPRVHRIDDRTTTTGGAYLLALKGNNLSPHEIRPLTHWMISRINEEDLAEAGSEETVEDPEEMAEVTEVGLEALVDREEETGDSDEVQGVIEVQGDRIIHFIFQEEMILLPLRDQMAQVEETTHQILPPPMGNLPLLAPRPPNDFRWQLSSKIPLSTIPEWNGSPTSVIQYVSKLSYYQQLGDSVTDHLAWVAPFKFTGLAKTWFNGLSLADRLTCTANMSNFLIFIREQFMHAEWRYECGLKFDHMYFRRGREFKHELPIEWVLRRISYAKLLYPEEAEVEAVVCSRVLDKRPRSWGTYILNEHSRSIRELLERVSSEESCLLYAWERERKEALDNERITRPSNPRQQSAYLAYEYSEDELPNPLHNVSELPSDSAVDQAEGLAVDYQRRKPAKPSTKQGSKHIDWPNGRTLEGHAFTHNDSQRSPSKPPGDCRLCTSPLHFYRECPHFPMWDAISKRLRAQGQRDPKDLRKVDREYEAHVASLRDDESDDSDSNYIVPEITEYYQLVQSSFNAAKSFHANSPIALNRTYRRRFDRVDEDKGKNTLQGPLDSSHAVSDPLSSKTHTPNTSSTEKSPSLGLEPNTASKRYTPSTSTNSSTHAVPNASPSRSNTPFIVAVKSRTRAPGRNAVGIRSLHIEAQIASPLTPHIHTQLDSGADITLISQDYLRSLPDMTRPTLKTGSKIQLHQLTCSATILGYITTHLYIKTQDTQIVQFDVEAYVVQDMKVPLLLGEDFMTSYEIGVTRKASGRCTVYASGGRLPINVSMSESYRLGVHIRKTYLGSKALQHRQARRARRRTPIIYEKEKTLAVVASESVTISPGHFANVAVILPEETQDAWFVEGTIITEEGHDLLAAPATLVTMAMPYLPITNPTTHPLQIRKGDLVGYAFNPQTHFETPTSSSHWESLNAHALAVKKLLNACQDVLNRDTSPSRTPPSPSQSSEQWGPKTTATPEDPTTDDVMQAVHLGPDIPEDVRPALEEVLRKRAKAFGLAGRLGRVDKKANIPLKPGIPPISLPMYGTSPAKREVMDAQLEKWFEQEVIEPSKSPWGSPCMVVYRNGKPRLVIDYCKLNAQTIPDEYPIPRQSEIIQSLSGSQVISSFDALAGFQQIEMDDDSKPITAFRCHRGLFQFRRMPLGLRNGPSIFQQLMQEVLSPFLWIFALVYIDDIVVYSRSWPDHLQHLDAVLGAIEGVGLTLSPPKCFIGFSSILLLGQKVSRLGLSTHREKVAAVIELAHPTSVLELQRFLGMVVYFSAYIPHYAHIASPLFSLLKKGV